MLILSPHPPIFFGSGLQFRFALLRWIPGFEQIFRQILAAPELVEPHGDLTGALPLQLAAQDFMAR